MKPIILAILSAVALCGCKPKESTAFQVEINTNATDYFFHYSYQQTVEGGKNGQGNATVNMTGKIKSLPEIESARSWIRDHVIPSFNGPSNAVVIIHWFTEIKQ